MNTPYDYATSVALVRSGSDYFDRCCQLIDQATQSIHLQTYIFTSDHTGQRIKKHLIQAARRGVKIFLLLDGFGSKDLEEQDIADLKSNGISIRFFSPLYKDRPFRIGRRLHHKLIVADDHKAIIGGMNISDHYSGHNAEHPWLDYAVYLSGDVCKKITRIAMSLFNRRFRPVSVFHAIKNTNQGIAVRIRQSDYMRGKKEIPSSYKEFVQLARNEILIVNAYFLPGYRMRRMLQKAVRNGVSIKVMLSAKSDVPVVKRAMNYYYQWLFRNKIAIYEYLPSNLHAKLAVFDHRYVTIGSFNLNYLSEYVSVELNVDINDVAVAREFHAELDHIIETACHRVERQVVRSKNPLSRLLDFISYQAVMYSMRVLYLLTRKDRINYFR